MDYFLLRLICNLTAGFLVFFFIMGMAFIAYRNRRKARKRILRNYLKLSKVDRVPDDHIMVRYCDSERFNRFWKLFPWYGIGWFINKRNEVIFLSEHNMEVIEKRYPRNRALIEWEGTYYLKNGALSWMKIEMDGITTYFTSETGVTIFGSKKQTKEIYETVKFGHSKR